MKQIIRSRTSTYFIIVTSLTLTLITSIMLSEAFSAEPNRIIVDLEPAQIDIHIGIKPQYKIVKFGGGSFSGTYPVKDWEVEQISPNEYRLRNKTWKDMFWEIDNDQNKISRKNGADIKNGGGSAEPLDGVFVDSNFSLSRLPANIRNEIAKTSNSTLMVLRLTTPQIVLDQKAVTVCVIAGGAVVSGTEEWEVRQVSKDIYHYRYKLREDFFWQIDVKSMKLYQIHGGNFGFPGGRLSALAETVRSEINNESTSQNGAPIDITMAQIHGDQPKSAWLESEKALNADAVARKSYDVLIVPFQVGGYAVDRIDRSIMTRILAKTFAQFTDLKIPSPTMIARALGEANRTYDTHDIYQFANKLGVKRIIRGYVGHDLNQQMKVTIIVQTREGNEYFSTLTNTEVYSWNDISISDEHTPSMAFESILPDIASRLHITPKHSSNKQKPSTELTPDLPLEITKFVVNSSTSPLVRAYYLQLLAMLHPEQSICKEQLFERSLIALRELPPNSPHHNLLKARALFYLHRRPAAAAILATPSSPEEMALSAVIDGNMQLLVKHIDTINEKLPRLIAQIELSDLRSKYSDERTSLDGLTNELSGWEWILKRRLSQSDVWNVQSNIEVKQLLDNIFPIKGYTVEDIVKNKLSVGELPEDEDDDIDFSFYNHYRRIMDSQAVELIANDNSEVIGRDLLDIMVSIGESNLLKKLRLRRAQALNEEIIKLVDRYNSIYSGHPEISLQKAIALYRISDTKQGIIQQNLREESVRIQNNICFWSQGQTDIALSSCNNKYYYYADYPRRWYWRFSNNPKGLSDRKYNGTHQVTQVGNISITPFDRKGLVNYNLSLLYTQADFSYLSSYYDMLKKLRMEEEAATLLRDNSSRFVGNTLRTSFYSWIAEKDGNIKQAKSIFEEAIALQPNNWNNYEGLSLLMIRQGEYKSASKYALNYPFFVNPQDQGGNSTISTVMLSKYAYKVGHRLLTIGAVDEAIPLMRISAGLDTGSGAEMASSSYLALLDQNFQLAAQICLKSAKRYNKDDDYSDYMELLHVMGYHKEARAVLSKMQEKLSLKAVMTGFRMEAKPTEEQIQWLNNKKYTSHDAVLYAFHVYAFDRKPVLNLSDRLKSIQAQIESSNAKPQPPASQVNKPSVPQITSPSKFASRFGDPIIPFADGYSLLKEHQFTDAYKVLDARFSDEFIRKDMFSYAIPYLAWSAAKNGKGAQIEIYLNNYKNELGDGFDYYLSQAFLAESKNNHAEAIRYLEAARNHIHHLVGTRILFPWYQLVEACEWMYEDSKFEGYREQMLKFAKLNQTIRPMDSWSYAFEAKYTKSDVDRVRALAITLYLDEHSERISHFSNREKDSARDWLKQNNPFHKSKQKLTEQEA